MSDRSDDIVKVDKSSWPRTTEGTIDWEVVFEHPENGLIPAISAAQKTDTLIDCAAVVTQTLFSRASDEDIRAKYTGELASIAINNTGEPLDTLLEHITDFLRNIKEDRIQRAAEWIIHKAQRNAASAMLVNSEDESAEQLKRANRDETELLFEDLFCDAVDQRFQVLWGGVDQKPMDGRKIPFILAAEFALRMQIVIRKEFMPLLIPKCRHIISAAQRVPADGREQFIRDKLADEVVRKELWDVWKYTWRHAMQEPELPKKPKTTEKGMFNSLVKAVQAIGESDESYSLEDWEEDVETTKLHQAAVRDIWISLMAPSQIFEPPEEEDKLLLMNMFAKTPGGMRDQISALRQISEQSDRVGQAFDVYAKGKDLQLPLLAISHQFPEKFLQGKMILKDMLGGMSKKDKQMDLPLVVRYLSDFI